MAARKGNKTALGNNGGRPSLYKPEYCEMAIAAGAEGKSLTAFAAEIDVDRRTITEWTKAHDEFSLAVTRAKAKCAAWWEERGRAIAKDGGGPGSATLVMFGLKNMGADDWSDTTRTEHSGTLGIERIQRTVVDPRD